MREKIYQHCIPIYEVEPVSEREQPTEKIFDEINWSDIMPQLLELIRECIAMTNKEKVTAELHNPGIRVTARLWRMYRRQGYRQSDLRLITFETLAELRSSSSVDIEELIAEAVEDDDESAR